MCTLSILRDDERVLVTMNRDEARTRAPELPVQTFASGDVAWLAPVDSDASGTWMGMNSAGLVACLMNRYRAENEAPVARPREKRSRGEIVMACLAQGGWDTALAWVENELDPAMYLPFTLTVVSWQGTRRYVADESGSLVGKDLSEDGHILASSSWHPEQVRLWREVRFRQWHEAGAPFDGPLPSFHVETAPGEETFAVMMSRELSCTRSITQAEIVPDGGPARLRYWPVVEGVVKGKGILHTTKLACPLPTSR